MGKPDFLKKLAKHVKRVSHAIDGDADRALYKTQLSDAQNILTQIENITQAAKDSPNHSTLLEIYREASGQYTEMQQKESQIRQHLDHPEQSGGLHALDVAIAETTRLLSNIQGLLRRTQALIKEVTPSTSADADTTNADESRVPTSTSHEIAITDIAITEKPIFDPTPQMKALSLKAESEMSEPETAAAPEDGTDDLSSSFVLVESERPVIAPMYDNYCAANNSSAVPPLDHPGSSQQTSSPRPFD